MNAISQILHQIQRGEPSAIGDLFSVVYDELRKLAEVKLKNERPDHTLNATALIHEAYLRLIGDQRFDNRGHFFAAAAEAMRRILVESARRKARLKNGGGRQRMELTDLPAHAPPEALLALDEALTRLSERDPQKADIVKLRYFVGMTMTEIANCLGISLATAERHWSFARIWLFNELNEEK